MKCYYHGDKDGLVAAFWVYLSAGKTDNLPMSDNIEDDFIQENPGFEIDFNKIRPNEQVYIVDLSISPDQMRRLLEITNNITWIDHHKSAIDKFENFEHDIRGIRYDGISGCMLTYCYLHHMTDRGQGEIKPFDIKMTEDAPLFTKLTDDYDIWTFKYGQDTKDFNSGFYLYDFKPNSKEWFKFFESNNREKEIIEAGKIITLHKQQSAKSYLKYGYETEFEGMSAFVINKAQINSDDFNDVTDKEKYDIFIGYVFNGDKYIISLRGNNKPVLDIAKKYSGGGHSNSAGFTLDYLPFTKKIKEEEINRV